MDALTAGIARAEGVTIGSVVLLPFNVEFKNFGVKNDVFFVEDVNLRKWFGLLHECDAFIGCDSIGQHIANIYDKPAYLALGSTYPENVTYPDNKNFTIFDFNKDKRIYSPIRITVDEYPDRQNEQAMTLTDDQIEEIANKILNDI